MPPSSSVSLTPRPASPDASRAWTVAVFVALAVLFALHAWVQYEGPAALDENHWTRAYARMVDDPFAFTESPIAYRWPMPVMLHVLPVPPGLGFLVLNTLFLFLTHVLLYRYLLALGLSRVRALQGVVILALSFAGWYIFNNYVVVDGLTLLAITGAFWAIQTRRRLVFWLFAIVGIINKQVVFFVLPLYFMEVFAAGAPLVGGRPPAFAKRLAVALVAAAVAAVALHVALDVLRVAVFGPEFAYENPLDAEKVKQVVLTRLLRPIFVKNLLALMTFSWFFIVANACLIGANRRYALYHAPYVVLTCFLLFTTFDSARILICLFPILVALAVNGFAPLDAWRASPTPLKASMAAALVFLAVPKAQEFLLGTDVGGLGLIAVTAAGALIVVWGLRTRDGRRVAQDRAIELLAPPGIP